MLLARHARACPGIHVFAAVARRKSWMAGTSSAKTVLRTFTRAMKTARIRDGQRGRRLAASAALAFSAIAWNARRLVDGEIDSTCGRPYADLARP